MKNKRINFWIKSLKETVLQALQMQLEECFYKNKILLIQLSQTTLTSQLQRVVNKQASC